MDDFRGKLSSLEPNRSREARPAAIEPFGLELTPASQVQPEGPTGFYNVAHIKFREAGQTYEADALDRRYLRSEAILVETPKGLALAFIARNSERKMSTQPAIKILRRVEDTDLRQVERNAAKEEEAFRFCMERVKARNLYMKLIRTEVLHGGNKAIFYFSADGRIDFRELVKDLAHKFHLRIEMRQVGVRDETKLMGGVGACGRELCCSTWLKDFAPVSLKMAKDQNLALNPQKVSGVCGRLMCCLSYEEDSYRELRRGLPRLGRRVMTPKGEGEVRELDVLRQRVRVAFDEFHEVFPVSELRYSALTEDEEEILDNTPERSRDERRDRGRRMLERRGIIGTGEASAAASASPAIQGPVLPPEPPIPEPETLRAQRPEPARPQRDERPRRDSPENRQRQFGRDDRQNLPREARDERQPPRDERREPPRNQRDENPGNQRDQRPEPPRNQRDERGDPRGQRPNERPSNQRPDDRQGPPRDERREPPRNQRDENIGNQRPPERRDDRQGPPRDQRSSNQRPSNQRPDDRQSPPREARDESREPPRNQRDENLGNQREPSRKPNERVTRDDRRRPPRGDNRPRPEEPKDNKDKKDE
jgi:cell fate regulator YaaT (PSP1 superfamily)